MAETGPGDRVQPIHATTVARRIDGGWIAVLLTGPSGAGKSDLALRLIAEGWRLVADDYTQVWASAGTVFATAPARIAGLIEARGLGVSRAPTPVRSLARVALVVDCIQRTPERAPPPARRTLAGLDLPLVTLDIRPASATATLSLAVRAAMSADALNDDGAGDDHGADDHGTDDRTVTTGRFKPARLSSI